MKKLVSIIIVNWNGKEYLKNCLISLRDQNYKNIEIIFVDNNSNDGSIDYVRDNFSGIKIISNKENLGYAEGNNVGYKYTTGDYVLFLNNDTKVTKNFLIELVKVLESDNKIGGAQSKIFLMDNPSILDSVGAFLTRTGFLYYCGVFKKNSSLFDKQIYLYAAKGACMFFKKEVLEKVKIEDQLFDDKYFAYFEETDMCHRVWLSGYRIVFAPKSVIYHKMGATSAKFDNAFVQYHSFKNRINSYIKNMSINQLIKVLPVHLLVCEFYALVSLLKFNFSLALAIQRSIVWNITNIRETFKIRKIIQHSIRKVSDDSIERYIYKYPPLSYYYHISDLSKYEDYE